VAENLYGNTKIFRIVRMQSTDKATLLGAGSIPYATGQCVDISGYTGWGRMRFISWAFTGVSGVTGPPTNATGILTFTPGQATFAYNRGGSTHSTGTTGAFGAGGTSVLTMYDKPQGTASAFTTRGFANTVMQEDRYFDCDNAARWIGGTVTIAGTNGPKFALTTEIEIKPKSTPTT